MRGLARIAQDLGRRYQPHGLAKSFDSGWACATENVALAGSAEIEETRALRSRRHKYAAGLKRCTGNAAARSRPPIQSVKPPRSATGENTRADRNAAQHPSHGAIMPAANITSANWLPRRKGAAGEAMTTRVEGYHLLAGGGFGPGTRRGRKSLSRTRHRQRTRRRPCGTDAEGLFTNRASAADVL